METDWAQIRKTLSRIQRELDKANRVIEATDVANDWPEVTRDQLEAAFPRWREECGSNWHHDFMEKKIGRKSYRTRRGSKTYRIDPEALRALQIEGDVNKPG